mmetsp:Transcript_20719/g.21372  ORF Transcript_20719/g.21372 Transcript_20719/m.21372 type:complete len:131 (-) Transcript_20719:58-450(-)
MSVRGVKQLKELIIRYSDYDGSSKGIRNWIRTDLIRFANENPELTIKAEIKRCAHPFFRGHYVNGNSKTICIKNLENEEITSYFYDLRNQAGNRVKRLRNKVTSETPSIQGEWHERMSLIDLDFKVQHIN